MKTIVGAIGSKTRGLTRKELTTQTGISDSGELSKQLKALISGDFIIEYNSFGNSKRETFYKLIDPYCNFYLSFMYGNKNNKRKGSKKNKEKIKILSSLPPLICTSPK